MLPNSFNEAINIILDKIRKDVTCGEIQLRYPLLATLLNSIYKKNEKQVNGHEIIPYTRDELLELSEALRRMYNHEFGETRTERSHNAHLDNYSYDWAVNENYQNNFVKSIIEDDNRSSWNKSNRKIFRKFKWDDFDKVPGVDALKDFIKYFSDNIEFFAK